MMAPGVGFAVAPQCSHLNPSALMRMALEDVGFVVDIVFLLILIEASQVEIGSHFARRLPVSEVE